MDKLVEGMVWKSKESFIVVEVKAEEYTLTILTKLSLLNVEKNLSWGVSGTIPNPRKTGGPGFPTETS